MSNLIMDNLGDFRPESAHAQGLEAVRRAARAAAERAPMLITGHWPGAAGLPGKRVEIAITILDPHPADAETWIERRPSPRELRQVLRRINLASR